MPDSLAVPGGQLTIEELASVARHGRQVGEMPEETRTRMQRSRDWLDEVLRDGQRTIYGVNTGFGMFAHTPVGAKDMRRLSRNCVTSCSAGVGDPLADEVIRGMMLIRLNVLAQGLSAARPEIAMTLAGMLNAGVTPYVPEKGSLGASGDLAPMSHIALVLSRGVDPDDNASGRAWLDSQLLSGEDAMARAGLERLVLEPKEGVSLTNGTDFMVASGALLVHDAKQLHEHAMIAAAMSIEAVRARTQAFHPAYHEATRQPGQIAVATRIRELLQGSRLADGDPARVQDAYSLRCIPQVLGPALDAVAHVEASVTRAMNAVTDNPLVVESSDAGGYEVLSGGNFHGEGPAFWLDHLAVVMTSAANIAERRIFRLLDPKLNEGLPGMLVAESGVDTGLMVAQYTAAALVADCKVLAHPDSVDSIPTSADQEDYVSMGANGARHAREVLDNVRRVIAIELYVAAQALSLRDPSGTSMSPATAAAQSVIRDLVPVLEHDRPISDDMEAIADLVASGAIVKAVERSLGH
ncbi:histidine ammonia-lyase [Streptomyces arenae]|uniref:histidine ammonia-lyase n=1 Tax=Streptomyces arenae TaxID=29301 RepID=UPI00265A565F|nr:histidine ammonia-lyase [Streptomyces arenae]MCG7207384.1 histidine ammonia-lyase [Streptomyces arenae]